MAEGWTRNLLDSSVEAYSAGTNLQPLNQQAVQVMHEVAVDISSHHSKHLSEFSDYDFDLVVTVCDNAAKSCPMPPKAAQTMHVPFDDPPQLAKKSKKDEEALNHYRRVRDEIKKFITTLPDILEGEK
jgi:arsenate reductase